MEWSDLRYVLAIARGGGLGGAARELKVDPSSVYRRLERLEATLGVRLFERRRTGYRLTSAGERLSDAAAGIESAVVAAERQVQGADLKATGTVRISTSEALALYFLPALLAEFHREHPDITLEVVVTNQPADLTRRDADIAIRVTNAPPEHLVGRRIGAVAYAAYVPKRLLRRGQSPPALNDLDWLGFDDTVTRFPQARWLVRTVPDARIVMRFDSLCALLRACEQGAGAAVLPCFLGDSGAALARLPGTAVQDEMAIYVLTHPDLRRSARIRTCVQFFAERIAACRPRLLGRQQSAAGGP